MERASRVMRLAACAVAAALAVLAAPDVAHAQLVHSKNGGVAACKGSVATSSINSAIEEKAGDAAIQEVAVEGHCFNVDPDVGFSVVKTFHVDGPNGGSDQVVGEITLQDGSRSRFYVNKDDIDPTPSNNPADYADPPPPAPADFGTAPFDPSKIPPPPAQ